MYLIGKMKFEDISVVNELPNTFYFDQILPVNVPATINERPAIELIQVLDTSSLMQCFSLGKGIHSYNTYLTSEIKNGSRSKTKPII